MSQEVAGCRKVPECITKKLAADNQKSDIYRRQEVKYPHFWQQSRFLA